ncbi:MAG: hypothetical protein A3F83_15285 [Candidatus Glassbacteria bacterium RIFCSPLOWO2_12_FULL_58_11]|uniref:Uncharacterized protein n=2 Tax=Candidatus Glassiibacteriota TaxID=1817805 RepID=A0A1F5YZ27_9BACT|nr:MAG: hypothetical protein A2Z86_03650 [Candidatus Glassbacteria bacterium GWA2_58_10]OGG05353.1 MAG: hypothetical protein A3F83_15285 [Candidatus Glassbacteria bacterium RIFCSPLOWO2_12_FULL_58_11]
MKIRKGLPAGYTAIAEELKPLLAKIQKLDPSDLGELDAFIDYLLKGADKVEEASQDNGSSKKIYEFMNGGLESGPAQDESPSGPEA